jgi:GTP-binding protein EngB required for normal cell division
MDYLELILRQGELAGRLHEIELDLTVSVPIARVFAPFPDRLLRVQQPVVAVTGEFNTGKTTLINRLATGKPDGVLPTSPIPTTLIPVFLRPGTTEKLLVHTPEGDRLERATAAKVRNHITKPEPGVAYVVLQTADAARIPWAWLDLPGENAPQGAPSTMDLSAFADLCLVATPATQPLTMFNRAALQELATHFPGETLIVVVTRADQLRRDDRDEVLTFVKDTLRTALTGRKVGTLLVSALEDEHLDELKQTIAKALAHQQRGRLEQALQLWRAGLQLLLRLSKEPFGFPRNSTEHDIDLLAAQFAKVPLARTELHRLASGAIVELKSRVPVLAEDAWNKCAQKGEETLARRFLDEYAGRLQEQIEKTVFATIREFGCVLQQYVPNLTFIDYLVEPIYEVAKSSHLAERSHLDASGNLAWFALSGSSLVAGLGGLVSGIAGLAGGPVGVAIGAMAGLANVVMASSSAHSALHANKTSVRALVLDSVERRLEMTSARTHEDIDNLCDALEELARAPEQFRQMKDAGERASEAIEKTIARTSEVAREFFAILTARGLLGGAKRKGQ